MRLRPTGDRALVRRLEAVDAGRIVIPGTAKEKPMEAEVVAVGFGKRLKSGDLARLSVRPGDKVLLGKYQGTEITIDGTEHVILRESEILGVMEG